MSAEKAPEKRTRRRSDQNTYIIQSVVAPYGDDMATARVVTLPDGKRIHVIERKTLNRAIKAAMKEFA
jgi:hypothetical protein